MNQLKPQPQPITKFRTLSFCLFILILLSGALFTTTSITFTSAAPIVHVETAGTTSTNHNQRSKQQQHQYRKSTSYDGKGEKRNDDQTFLSEVDKSFANLGRSFNSMRRQIRNMMRISNERMQQKPFSTLFDDRQWFGGDNSQSLNERIENSQRSSLSSISSNNDFMKSSPPISSQIKTINQDGKNELSIQLFNIPTSIFSKKDIQLTVKETSFGDFISISGKKQQKSEMKEQLSNEFFQFAESFKFPSKSLNLDQVKAHLSDDGTLSVKIPKIEPQPETAFKEKEISID